MKISAVCNKCGDIADAEYLALSQAADTIDNAGKQRRVVKIHCAACGDYERAPHCHVDLADTRLLRLLVL